MEWDETQTRCVSRDNKAIYQILAQNIEAYRKKYGKPEFLVRKGAFIQNLTISDKTWTWSVSHHNKAIYIISARYLNTCGKKLRGTLPTCNIPSPKRDITHLKINENQTILELDLWVITTNPYTKFQLDTSKHAEKSAETTYV